MLIINSRCGRQNNMAVIGLPLPLAMTRNISRNLNFLVGVCTHVESRFVKSV